jgi:molecular chaperone DnaJ
MAEALRDYYEVLGIPRDADAKAIKDAFRKLAMQYHPDRNKAPDAEARFKEIAEAYAILSDPKKRAEYDTRGHAGVAGFSAEDLFSGIDFGDIFGNHFADFGFGFGDGLFDRLFRHRQGPARGRDLEVHLIVPLERIFKGGEEMVRFSRTAPCPACHGSGAVPGTQPRQCDACKGSGRKVLSQRDEGGMHFEQITTCPVCHGSGTLIDTPCKQCHGLGQVEKEESLRVNIPAGAEEGMVLRVPGHGLAADTGNRSGDLFVVVRTATHPKFTRNGADLWRSETIEVADAVLGKKLKVPTMEGKVEVTIPPGTQPDEVLRLRGKGLPYYGGGGYGNLNLRIQVHIPEQLSASERILFQRLRELEGGKH